jgi:hypothetical protein
MLFLINSVISLGLLGKTLIEVQGVGRPTGSEVTAILILNSGSTKSGIGLWVVIGVFILMEKRLKR